MANDRMPFQPPVKPTSSLIDEVEDLIKFIDEFQVVRLVQSNWKSLIAPTPGTQLEEMVERIRKRIN